MDPEKDTPQGETVPQAPSEATATPPNAGTPTPEEANAAAVERAEFERVQKELEQTRMRANQLENERKKFEEQQKQAELDRLARENNWEEIAKKTQAELEAIRKDQEAEQARKDAEAFRDQVLAGYPENVQKAAKALIAKDPANLSWKEASSWDSAKQQLTEQLDTLKEVLGSAPGDAGEGSPARTPDYHPNNPATPTGLEKPLHEMSLEEMRAILPKSNRTF